MRIISGCARGSKLFTPGQAKTIRPTSDRAKEALFSIIGERIHGANVLDLYTGTGALGLESLSRGASRVLLVDFYKNAMQLAEKNFTHCFQNMADIPSDAVRLLKHDLRRGLDLHYKGLPVTDRFDIIFLDPPYGKELAVKTLKDLDKCSLYTEHSLIVAEESSDEALPESFSHLMLTDRRQYGESSFWFYQVKH